MKSFLVIAVAALGALVVAGGLLFFGGEGREAKESVAPGESDVADTQPDSAEESTSQKDAGKTASGPDDHKATGLDEGESEPVSTSSEANDVSKADSSNPSKASPEPPDELEAARKSPEAAPGESVSSGSSAVEAVSSGEGSQAEKSTQSSKPDEIEESEVAALEREVTSTEGSETVSGNGRDMVLPSFDVVRVERDGSFVAAGRAAPGSQVSILADGQEVASVQADQRGEWVLLPDEALLAGDHELSLSSASGSGGQLASRDVVVVSVPEAMPRSEPQSSGEESLEVTRDAAETVSQQKERPLAVLMPREGEGEARVLQGPEGGMVAGELSLDSITYDEEGQLLASGQLVPGERVFMYVDDRFVGQARANDEGRWQLRPEQSLEGGKYTIRIDQVDEQGNVVARLETPFVREEISAARAGSSEVVVVQPGNSLWRLARGSYGRGIHYTLIYEANDDQIEDPDLIYPGQVFEVPGLEDGQERKAD